ncbi:MAG: DUF4159 domain-containing protein [bacterium]
MNIISKIYIITLSLLQLGAFLENAAAQLPDGDEFTFVRIQWMDNGIRYGYGFSTNAPLWAHDYPTAEKNLYTVLKALTSIKISENYKVLTFDDDEIFKYPFIYACEIGYLTLSEKEVAKLREYLLRGGVLMVDDFRGFFEMQNWIREIRKVLPEYSMKKLNLNHPLFHCFFDLKDIYQPTPYLPWPPEYYAIFDENDRMMVIINFNNDVGDGWEWPNDPRHEYKVFSTEAFKIGINYLIYSLTH